MSDKMFAGKFVPLLTPPLGSTRQQADGVFVSPSDFRPCTVTRVVDGDTVELSVTFGRGFDFTYEGPARLAGINAQERNTEAGKAAAEVLSVMCAAKALVVELLGRDKFGRLLVRLWACDSAPFSINQRMINDGHAAPWDGRGDRPVVP